MTEQTKRGRPSKLDTRKQEILKKAAECFTKNGYNKTTLDDIGEALAFNKAALYYYFKNKEDLFSQVMHSEMIRLWDTTKSETNAVQGLENKMVRYFEVRSELAIGLIKLNELSKLNLIALHSFYSKAMHSFREKEISFLTVILSETYTKHTAKEVKDFIMLLISVQSSITMSALLLRSDDCEIKTNKLKKAKLQVLKHLLNSFANLFLKKVDFQNKSSHSVK